jgi:hypothetical protein
MRRHEGVGRVSDEDAFSQLALDVAVESEEEADAALAAELQLALRRAFDARESCWPGRDVHDSLRRTCHAAEVLHRVSFDAESTRIVREAGTWLINLRLPDRLDPADRDRTRLYPSRFKTLAYLGRFHDPVVHADFADLLRKENGGVVRGVTESDMLTTCIVLDTLLSLEQLKVRREVCPDRRFDAILGAVKRHFRNWRPATVAELAEAPAARARRGSGPLSEIEDARELSYAWGLLQLAGSDGIPQVRMKAAVADLLRVLGERAAGRGVDVLQALYAALQLAEHCRGDEAVQRALSELLAYLRVTYRRPDATRGWGIGHHTLVLRLLVTHYGDAALARAIAACFLRDAERRRRSQESAFTVELRHVIRERVEIELGAIQELSGGHTDAEVYRVPFRYWYPMPGVGNGRRLALDETHAASVIVKRSTSDAFSTATENYRQLPDMVRHFFVRQPAESQVYKSARSQAYYLAMEDLADYTPFAALMDRFDQRQLSDEHRWLLENAAAGICRTTFTLFRETAVARSGLPGAHLARLYVSPVEAKLLRAVRNVPWLKSAVQEFTVGDVRYRELDHYLGVISRSASGLQPRALGMAHGDLHAGNILLDADCQGVKLIDLDKLTRSGDYLADLGNLLADVCVGRRVARPEADFGLRPEDITFPTKAEAGTAENAVRYPALGRPATLLLQRQMLEHIAAFAADQRDATWRPRLWLACGSALLIRLAFEKQKERAAVLYGEAIRLLGELCRHVEQSAALPALLFPESWPQPPARAASETPEWIRRAPVLRGVHDGLRGLGLHALADHATVTYLAPSDSGQSLAKLVPPGREGIGRLLLPSAVVVDGARPTVKVVRSPHGDDAFGTILILTDTTPAAEVLAIVQAAAAAVSSPPPDGHD